MIRYLFLTACLLFGLVPAYGQTDAFPPTAETGTTALRISYEGQSGYLPGLTLGIEQELRRHVRKKVKRNGKLKERRRMWLGSVEAGYWLHPQRYTATHVRSGIMWRKVRTRGRKIEVGLSLGAIRRENWGRTYRVTADGDVRRTYADHRYYFMPNFELGIGRDYLYAKKPRRFSWHVRPNLSVYMPFNATFVPTMGIRWGIAVYLPDRTFRSFLNKP